MVPNPLLVHPDCCLLLGTWQHSRHNFPVPARKQSGRESDRSEYLMANIATQVSSMWGAVPAETCFNMDGHWISLVTWDVSTDVFILAMVIPLIWQLQLKVRDKAMLTGVFMLGAM